ncbi:ATP synthase-coupling factor 6, mitochondrial-like [Eurytemora carolleeae]|uniref:ATP synthase-coupling factor 6, mitochondrial-like n=1 Tax=Eurytemora carolleeae TaxID=1294199 RepID=UPI000C76E339|nr:ATP synthase-coupling factor 6, mitochondrial-like [Eurytemora carolleeae]|eukprot:XP_023328877.1 ATP synthase-coupling factor 6, mitochondrial-like [Eurytemora affinis]
MSAIMSKASLISFAAKQGVRNLSIAAPAAQKVTDPIQGLFVEKIREYATKKQAAGGKMVDANKATEAELQAELDKVARAYGGGAGVDMTSFPEFKFAEPVIEPINISQ